MRGGEAGVGWLLSKSFCFVRLLLSWHLAKKSRLFSGLFGGLYSWAFLGDGSFSSWSGTYEAKRKSKELTTVSFLPHVPRSQGSLLLLSNFQSLLVFAINVTSRAFSCNFQRNRGKCVYSIFLEAKVLAHFWASEKPICLNILQITLSGKVITTILKMFLHPLVGIFT